MQPDHHENDPPPSGRKKWFKHLFYGFTGIVSILYLLNFGVGFLELIPDNIPFIGNLDEAAFTVLLLKSLAHFGLPTGLTETIKRVGRKKISKPGEKGPRR
jgi:hypothetical protein